MFQPLIRAVCLASGLLILASCSDGTPPVPPDPADVAAAERFRIEGSLQYRQRIALPPDAQAVLELREGPHGPLAAEQRLALRGRQVPVAFGIELDRELLAPATDYVLQVAVEVADKPRWVAGPIPVAFVGALAQLGEIRLEPAGLESEPYVFHCGDRRITVHAQGDDLELSTGDEIFHMRPVVSASGAKYSLSDDPSTVFWSKGSQALLEIRGESWPECVAAGPQDLTADTDTASRLRATGHEPSWLLEIGPTNTELLTQFGAERSHWPTPQPEVEPGMRRWTTPATDAPVVITAREQICIDSMSGMHFPLTVSVDTGEALLRGCGGRPVELLLGSEWRVESIGGDPLVEGSRIVLSFSEAGRVSGSASCNRYSGAFTLTGERLSFGHAAATKMACAPALMEQEQRYFGVLADVTGFAIAPDGALELTAAEASVLVARRGD